MEKADDKKVIARFFMQLRINLNRDNLKSKTFLAQRTRKIMTPLSYHSSNLLLIAQATMRLLVPERLDIPS